MKRERQSEICVFDHPETWVSLLLASSVRSRADVAGRCSPATVGTNELLCVIHSWHREGALELAAARLWHTADRRLSRQTYSRDKPVPTRWTVKTTMSPSTDALFMVSHLHLMKSVNTMPHFTRKTHPPCWTSDL